jgi:hypothetical protein
MKNGLKKRSMTLAEYYLVYLVIPAICIRIHKKINRKLIRKRKHKKSYLRFYKHFRNIVLGRKNVFAKRHFRKLSRNINKRKVATKKSNTFGLLNIVKKFTSARKEFPNLSKIKFAKFPLFIFNSLLRNRQTLFLLPGKKIFHFLKIGLLLFISMLGFANKKQAVFILLFKQAILTLFKFPYFKPKLIFIQLLNLLLVKEIEFKQKKLYIYDKILKVRFLFFNALGATIAASIKAFENTSKILVSFRGLHARNTTAHGIINYLILKLSQYFTIQETLRPIILDLRSTRPVDAFRIIAAGRTTRKERAAYLIKQRGNITLGTKDTFIDFAQGVKILRFGLVGLQVYLNINLKKHKPVHYVFNFKPNFKRNFNCLLIIFCILFLFSLLTYRDNIQYLKISKRYMQRGPNFKNRPISPPKEATTSQKVTFNTTNLTTQSSSSHSTPPSFSNSKVKNMREIMPSDKTLTERHVPPHLLQKMRQQAVNKEIQNYQMNAKKVNAPNLVIPSPVDEAENVTFRRSCYTLALTIYKNREGKDFTPVYKEIIDFLYNNKNNAPLAAKFTLFDVLKKHPELSRTIKNLNMNDCLTENKKYPIQLSQEVTQHLPEELTPFANLSICAKAVAREPKSFEIGVFHEFNVFIEYYDSPDEVTIIQMNNPKGYTQEVIKKHNLIFFTPQTNPDGFVIKDMRPELLRGFADVKTVELIPGERSRQNIFICGSNCDLTDLQTSAENKYGIIYKLYNNNKDSVVTSLLADLRKIIETTDYATARTLHNNLTFNYYEFWNKNNIGHGHISENITLNNFKPIPVKEVDSRVDTIVESSIKQPLTGEQIFRDISSLLKLYNEFASPISDNIP